MFLEVTQLDERFLTDPTNVGLGIQVSHNVFLKINPLREVTSTAFATERLLAGMGQLMALHIRLLGK